MTGDKAFTIRSYRKSDRDAVRRLCCQTGFLGEPIDPVYEDRQLFADFLTTYYTDHEPESSFVLEIGGELRGYLLGSRRPLQNQLYSFWQNVSLFLKALTRYYRYKQRSRRFVRWLLVHGWREVPAAPRRVPHFHINLLPDARKMSTTRALMSAYLSYLYRCGEKRVYGQIVTFESRRGEKMFERYGFKVLNRAKITKYKAFYPESVYLSTVIKDLETAGPLSTCSRVPAEDERPRFAPEPANF
jgi:L-amino acid N-acyltransferase YncA